MPDKTAIKVYIFKKILIRIDSSQSNLLKGNFTWGYRPMFQSTNFYLVFHATPNAPVDQFGILQAKTLAADALVIQGAKSPHQ